jgi:hypothetical protein
MAQTVNPEVLDPCQLASLTPATVKPSEGPSRNRVGENEFVALRPGLCHQLLKDSPRRIIERYLPVPVPLFAVNVYDVTMKIYGLDSELHNPGCGHNNQRREIPACISGTTVRRFARTLVDCLSYDCPPRQIT